MRILHIVASLEHSYAGVSTAASGLCNHLVESCDVDIATATEGGACYEMDPRIGLLTKKRWSLPGLRVSMVPGFKHSLEQWIRQRPPDILHIHGMWLAEPHMGFTLAAKMNIPCVLSPHGMLDTWALAHRVWKKRMALRLYQQQDLLQARCLHATAPLEAEQFRLFGIQQPIAVVPLGLDLPPAAAFAAPRPSPKNVRTLLFLSRVHKKKGLLDLVDVWALVRPPGWRVLIAGPDDDGHLAEVKQRVQARGVGQDFAFAGPVYGEDKEKAYAQADLFVLPSYSENFGFVVPEALAHGIPVITTRATPWSDLETHRCGWWIDVGVDALTATLRTALSLSDAERQTMGARGQKLVQSKYLWPVVAKQMLTTYEWILQGGIPPTCVQKCRKASVS